MTRVVERLAEAFKRGAIWSAVMTVLIFGLLFGMFFLTTPSLTPITIAVVAALWLAVYVFGLLAGRYFRNACGELAWPAASRSSAVQPAGRVQAPSSSSS